MNIIDNSNKALLFWIDCEMTGLDVAEETILEIGIKITDMAGQNTITGPSYVIHQPRSRLMQMDEWCLRTHESNGLIAESEVSLYTLADAEEGVIQFIENMQYDDIRYMAGSSIWCDRTFIQKYMPRLAALFHYRMLDVSSLKIIFQHHFKKPYVFPKSERHRVMDDIDGSIMEYRYYVEHIVV
jgi:oligoribonuclease